MLEGGYSTVDRSCTRRFQPGEQNKIEDALAQAMTRADRCESVYSFPEMRCVKAVLSRARFNCSRVDGACAWAFPLIRLRRWIGFETSRYDSHFQIGLNLSCVSRNTDRKTRKPVQSLVHEAMHHCAVNNQTTHDHNRGARLSDRVYFLSAACDPEAFYRNYGSRGRRVYNSGTLHRGCMTALTRVADGIPRSSAEVSFSTVWGPPVRGRVSSTREARIYCDRVVEVVEEVKKYRPNTSARRRWVFRFRDQIRRYEAALRNQMPRDAESLSAIKDTLSEIQNLQSFRGSIGNAVLKLKEKRQQLERIASLICAVENPRRTLNSTFCTNGAPILQALLEAIERSENEIPVEVRLLSRD